MGAPGTASTRSRSRAGRARRWRRWSSRACAARRCCARRTRSWRRRSPRCTRAPRSAFVDCNRDDLCMSFAALRGGGRAPPPAGGDARAHRRAHRVRDRADRRAVPRRGHLPDRGLRARARRVVARPAARAPGATRACGRSTRPRRSRPARAACSCPATRTLLEFARAFRNYGKPEHAVAGLNFRLSEFTAALGLVQTERHGGDRRVEERGRARAPRPAASRPPPAAGRDGLRALQVHRLRPDRALDRQGLRRAVPPHHGPCRATCRTRDWVAGNHWCVPLYYRPTS